MQTTPRDQFVHVNQTGITSNRSSIIKWPTIIICVIFVITGQSIARLLENFYYLHTNNKRRLIVIQSLLQVIGLPFIHTPLYLFLLFKKQNQLPFLSNQTCHKSVYLLNHYPCIGFFMALQAIFSSASKLQIPFNVFTLIFTTQLLFTLIFSFFIHKLKFNRWIFISFLLAIAAGSLSLNSSFPGEPNEGRARYTNGVTGTLIAAFFFSIVLGTIQSLFDMLISKRNVATNTNSIFAYVVELSFISSIVTTVFSLAAVFKSGEYHFLKRDIRGFSEGKKLYWIIMMGQVVAWQIYWVGLVGLVFAVSSMFSNVISVCTWPIVSALVVLFFDFDKDEFDGFKGAALACAFLSAASYFYTIQKHERNSHETTS